MAVLATAGVGVMIGMGLGPAGELIAAAAAPQVIPATSSPVAAAPVTEEPVATTPAPTGNGSATTTPVETGTDPAPDPAPEPEPKAPPAKPGPDPDPNPPVDQGPTEVVGPIVHVNPAAGSYAISTGAEPAVVHTQDIPVLGRRVSVGLEPLANGTFREATERKGQGKATEATIAGTVTYVDDEARSYVLSSPGASILIELDPADPNAELPLLASRITSVVEFATGDAARAIEPADVAAEAATTSDACAASESSPPEPFEGLGRLIQASFTVDFNHISNAKGDGIVQATCPELGLLVVSADDVRASGADLVLEVPAALDASWVTVGDSVALSFDPTPLASGGRTLAGLADDEGARGADDDGSAQGDLARMSARPRGGDLAARRAGTWPSPANSSRDSRSGGELPDNPAISGVRGAARISANRGNS